MTPDQPTARRIAKAAWELCEAEDWHGAVRLFEEAVPLLDDAHWSTQEILGEYALALSRVGRLKEQVVALTDALNSAIRVDGPLALPAAIARHFLIEALFRQDRIAEAKHVLAGWPDKIPEGRWLLNFTAAMLALAEHDQVEFEKRCDKVWETAPNGKWETIDDLKAAIRAEMRT